MNNKICRECGQELEKDRAMVCHKCAPEPRGIMRIMPMMGPEERIMPMIGPEDRRTAEELENQIWYTNRGECVDVPERNREILAQAISEARRQERMRVLEELELARKHILEIQDEAKIQGDQCYWREIREHCTEALKEFDKLKQEGRC